MKNVVSKSVFVIPVLIASLAGCAKNAGPVATIKNGGSPSATSFDSFMYNDNPKHGQKYQYSHTTTKNEVDLGSVKNDNKHRLAGSFMLTLMKDGEFHLLYYEFMYLKKLDGSVCQIGGNTDFRRVNKMEFQGNWTRNNNVLNLENVGTLTRPTAGGPQATLQFGVSQESELSQQTALLDPMADSNNLSWWQTEQSQPKLSIAEATSQLDADCK